MPAVLAAVCLLVLATPALAGDGPNEEQSGENSLCLDHTLFQGTAFTAVTDMVWLNGDHAPMAAIVDVDPGTWFLASADGPLTDVTEDQGGEVHLHFWDEEANWVGTSTATHGLVPEGADHATICVGFLGEGPGIDAPDPTAEWTYQDGFETADYEG